MRVVVQLRSPPSAPGIALGPSYGSNDMHSRVNKNMWDLHVEDFLKFWEIALLHVAQNVKFRAP
jgi:hypothetical protein